MKTQRRTIKLLSLFAVSCAAFAAAQGAVSQQEEPAVLPLKFADTYYGEMTHYGLYRLAWADVRRAR